MVSIGLLPKQLPPTHRNSTIPPRGAAPPLPSRCDLGVAVLKHQSVGQGHVQGLAHGYSGLVRGACEPG